MEDKEFLKGAICCSDPFKGDTVWAMHALIEFTDGKFVPVPSEFSLLTACKFTRFCSSNRASIHGKLSASLRCSHRDLSEDVITRGLRFVPVMVICVTNIAQPRNWVWHFDCALHDTFVTVLVVSILIKNKLMLRLTENRRCRSHGRERNTFMRVQAASSVVERGASWVHGRWIAHSRTAFGHWFFRSILFDEFIVWNCCTSESIMVIHGGVEVLAARGVASLVVFGKFHVKVRNPAKFTVHVSFCCALWPVRETSALQFVIFIGIRLAAWCMTNNFLVFWMACRTVACSTCDLCY